MRQLLAVLMFASMIQVAQADDNDNDNNGNGNGGGGVVTSCTLVTENDVTQCL